MTTDLTASYHQRAKRIGNVIPWTLLVITLLFAAGIAWHFSGELVRAEHRRQHDLKLACLRMLMWLDANQKLQGLNAHAFGEWLPLAQRTSRPEKLVRYEWHIRPEHNEGLAYGWIEVTESGMVLRGQTIAAEN